MNTPLRAAQLRGRAWWGYTSVATGSAPSPQAACEAGGDPTVCEAAPRRQIELRQAQVCRYDNYAYTLLDAMVQRRTGRPLWRWSLQLIARPLGMHGTSRCMAGGGGEGGDGEGGGSEGGEGGGVSSGGEGGVAGCFGPPPTPEVTLRPEQWRRWRGGPETTSWASGNGMFGSARDLLRFLGMLANPNPNPNP